MKYPFILYAISMQFITEILRITNMLHIKDAESLLEHLKLDRQHNTDYWTSFIKMTSTRIGVLFLRPEFKILRCFGTGIHRV